MSTEENQLYIKRLRLRNSKITSEKGQAFKRGIWDILIKEGHDRSCAWSGGMQCDCNASVELDKVMNIWADIEIDGIVKEEWL